MTGAAARLVLASASATRAGLLRAAGLGFAVQPAAVDEPALRAAARGDGLGPGEAALCLALAKARQVRAARPDALVLGADQILAVDDIWLDKPRDRAEAAAQLRLLRGRRHVLHTAAVLLDADGVWTHLARPILTMRDFSDGFLDAYLTAEGEAVLTSVGAYRFEGIGAQLFDAAEGEQAAILGLPLLALLEALRARGEAMT